MTRAWMIVAPLVFAALLIAHPMGDTFYAAASEHNTAWLTVHVGAAVFFPLMAAVVWCLLRGLDGRAALVARGSLLVFAVFYTAWEVMTGIATGVLAGAGDVEGVERITTHWISGELGLFNSVGALAWTAAIAAAVVALRDAPRPVDHALGSHQRSGRSTSRRSSSARRDAVTRMRAPVLSTATPSPRSAASTTRTLVRFTIADR